MFIFDQLPLNFQQGAQVTSIVIGLKRLNSLAAMLLGYMRP